MTEQTVWGLIIAVGRGQQMTTGTETAFLGIGSRPALAHSVAAFDHSPGVEGLVVVASRERVDAVQTMVRRYGCSKPVHVVAGFQARRASVRAGLQAMEAEPEWVVIQDAARPCVTPELIAAVVTTARRYGHGVTAARIPDTVARAESRAMRAGEVWPSDAVWALQTPQCYRRSLLERMLEAADKANLKAEDEAAALPLLKEPIRLVPCETANIRLSAPDDLALASNLLR